MPYLWNSKLKNYVKEIQGLERKGNGDFNFVLNFLLLMPQWQNVCSVDVTVLFSWKVTDNVIYMKGMEVL
jgi:hypothetical protein